MNVLILAYASCLRFDMLLFSLPKFFHLQNKHNYNGSHFLKKIIHLYRFPNFDYQSGYISLTHSVLHSSRWLLYSFIFLTTDSTVDLDFYFASKKRDIPASSHHHILPPLTCISVCSPYINELSALSSG